MVKNVENFISDRLKKARKYKKMSRKELAFTANISVSSIDSYELNRRKPSLETLEKLAAALDVDVLYLKGSSNDFDGLDLWEEATGYSQELIQKELNQIKETGRSTGDRQQDIWLAISNLEQGPKGHGDMSAVKYASTELDSLSNRIIRNYYIDPTKREVNSFGEPNAIVLHPGQSIEELFYKDVDPRIYNLIANVLLESKRLISNGATYIHNHEKSNSSRELLADSINRLEKLVKDITAPENTPNPENDQKQDK